LKSQKSERKGNNIKTKESKLQNLKPSSPSSPNVSLAPTTTKEKARIMMISDNWNLPSLFLLSLLLPPPLLQCNLTNF